MNSEEGWRLPNQRELFIISFYLKEEGMVNTSLFSCTKSASGNEYCGYSRGVGDYSIPTMTVWSDDTKDKNYRCVRDVKLTN